MKNQLRTILAIGLSATLLGTQTSFVAFANNAPPPVAVVPLISLGETSSVGVQLLEEQRLRTWAWGYRLT
jgi:hypothetical protein